MEATLTREFVQPPFSAAFFGDVFIQIFTFPDVQTSD